MQINFRTIEIFDRELQKLAKKYPSLEKDFGDFCAFLQEQPIGLWIGDIEQINNLGKEIILPIYKVRKFRCASLSKNSTQSGIRIIYVYDASNDMIEFIEFVEIYYKWQKEMEDRARIIDLYSWKDSLSS